MTIEAYLQALAKLMSDLPLEPIDRLVDLLRKTRQDGRCAFVFGNGGSAATASHFACDLGKGTVKADSPRFRVLTLHDVPTLSAYANDLDYSLIFAEQIRSQGRPRDVALAISASGDSENVLRAVEIAGEIGMRTVGLTGFEGGVLGGLVDLCIIVPSDDMQLIEDAHMGILHAVFREFT